MNFKSLTSSEFKKNVLTLMTGTSISQAIAFLAGPILSRIYTPDDFGVLATFMSLTILLSIISTGKYELSILLPKNNKNSSYLVHLSILLSLIISIISTIIILFFDTEIADLLNSELILDYLILVPMTSFLVALFQIFNYWHNRQKKFKSIASAKISQTSVFVFSSIALKAFPFNALLIGDIISRFCSALVLIVNAIRHPSFYLKMNLKKTKALAIRYLDFPKFSMPSSLLNSTSIQAPVLLLQLFFSSTITGFYSLAHRIISAPLTLLSGSVSQVFLQKISENKSDKQKLAFYTQSAYKKLFQIGIIPLSLVLVFGDYIFSFVYGENWVVAGEFAQILAPWMFIVFTTSPLTNVFIVLERQKTLMLFNMLLLAVRLSVLCIGGLYLNSSFITMLLFSLSSFVLLFVQFIYILRLLEINVIKTSMFSLFLGSAIVVPLYLIRMLLEYL